MSHLLKEKDIVHCESQEQYDRIIAFADAAGVPVYDPSRCNDVWSKYGNLSFNDKKLVANSAMRGSPLYQWHTEAEFVAKMFGIASKAPPIRIDNREVEFFYDGSIVVGCTRVGNDTLNAVCERANKMKKP